MTYFPFTAQGALPGRALTPVFKPVSKVLLMLIVEDDPDVGAKLAYMLEAVVYAMLFVEAAASARKAAQHGLT